MRNRTFCWLVAIIVVAIITNFLTVMSTDNRSVREKYLDTQVQILTLEAEASSQYKIRDIVGFQYSKDKLRILEESSRSIRNQHNEQLLRELWRALSVTGDKELLCSTYNERRL
jgi:hypothetical protein